MAGNLHPQEGIVNEQERARKREKNIKKRRRARVCIVVNFLKTFIYPVPGSKRVGEKDQKSAKTAWELGRTESLALRCSFAFLPRLGFKVNAVTWNIFYVNAILEINVNN